VPGTLVVVEYETKRSSLSAEFDTKDLRPNRVWLGDENVTMSQFLRRTRC
jgi:hypothetical protein